MTTQLITSDQSKQFKRFVEDASDRALKEIGLDKDGLQRLIERGGDFQSHIVLGIKRFAAKVPNYDTARTILGQDFISPEEIATARGVTYTDEQLAKFGDSLPDQEALEWCRDNGMMLVAGPPKAMSLLDVRSIKADYFYSKEGGWYADKAQKFAKNDKAEPVWIALRKEPVADSRNKTWPDQQELVSAPMAVPNVAEAVWGITTYKAVRGVYLLPDVYVRTSSVDSGGNRVRVGDFDADGLRVDLYWDGHRDSDLGVSASRQSPLYPSVKSRPRAGFALSLLSGLYPATEHPPDLINL